MISDGEPELTITQNDIRQIQLAKAALYAGCRLLMDALGIETVDLNAQGVDIEPGIGLIEDGQPRRKHRHLKDFVTFLFSSRKSFIKGTRQEFTVNFQ